MNPQEFISCIRREVLDANLAMYKQGFEHSASITTKQDSRWPRMATLYQSLTEQQQVQLMEAIRQVMEDTLSNVLGILDGSTLLENHRGSFHLTYDDKPEELNGELQDIFLSRESE